MPKTKTLRHGSKSSSTTRGRGRLPSSRTSSVPKHSPATQVVGRGWSTARSRGRPRTARAPIDLELVPPSPTTVPGSSTDNASDHDLSSFTMDRLLEVIRAEVQRASVATSTAGSPSPPPPSLPPTSISGDVVSTCFRKLLVHAFVVKRIPVLGSICPLKRVLKLCYTRGIVPGCMLRMRVSVHVYVCVVYAGIFSRSKSVTVIIYTVGIDSHYSLPCPCTLITLIIGACNTYTHVDSPSSFNSCLSS